MIVVMKQRLKAWGSTEVVPIVSIVVLDEQGSILLLRRHNADLGGGKWGTPGGRLEAGEDTKVAATRELYEETGVRVGQLGLLGAHSVSMPHGTVHMTSYVAQISRDTAIVLDPEEHQAHLWARLEDILYTPDILWGMPTVLRDFGLLTDFEADPTLAGGSRVRLLTRAD
jgi:8-oxo-dGTP diphosphatase